LTAFFPDFELLSPCKKPTNPCPYREPDPATYPTVAGEQVTPPILGYILKACEFILSNTFFLATPIIFNRHILRNSNGVNGRKYKRYNRFLNI
jgi:hypothetical protein